MAMPRPVPTAQLCYFVTCLWAMPRPDLRSVQLQRSWPVGYAHAWYFGACVLISFAKAVIANRRFLLHVSAIDPDKPTAASMSVTLVD
jgi:hypothetical protein